MNFSDIAYGKAGYQTGHESPKSVRFAGGLLPKIFHRICRRSKVENSDRYDDRDHTKAEDNVSFSCPFNL